MQWGQIQKVPLLCSFRVLVDVIAEGEPSFVGKSTLLTLGPRRTPPDSAAPWRVSVTEGQKGRGAHIAALDVILTPMVACANGRAAPLTMCALPQQTGTNL